MAIEQVVNHFSQIRLHFAAARSPLMNAAFAAFNSLLDTFAEMPSDPIYSPVYAQFVAACATGRVDILRRLIAEGLDPDLTTDMDIPEHFIRMDGRHICTNMVMMNAPSHYSEGHMQVLEWMQQTWPDHNTDFIALVNYCQSKSIVKFALRDWIHYLEARESRGQIESGLQHALQLALMMGNAVAVEAICDESPEPVVLRHLFANEWPDAAAFIQIQLLRLFLLHPNVDMVQSVVNLRLHNQVPLNGRISIDFSEIAALRFAQSHNMSPEVTRLFASWFKKQQGDGEFLTSAIMRGEKNRVQGILTHFFERFQDHIRYLQHEMKRLVYDPDRMSRIVSRLRHDFDANKVKD
jgi:hypothetical protein